MIGPPSTWFDSSSLRNALRSWGERESHNDFEFVASSRMDLAVSRLASVIANWAPLKRSVNRFNDTDLSCFIHLPIVPNCFFGTSLKMPTLRHSKNIQHDSKGVLIPKIFNCLEDYLGRSAKYSLGLRREGYSHPGWGYPNTHSNRWD